MSPILTGVIASGITGKLNTWSPEGAYDALASITLSTSAASITFSGIPSDYKHLQIRGIVRGVETGDYFYNGLRVGMSTIDTATNYSWHNLGGDGGGSATSTASTSQDNIRVLPVGATGAMLSNNYSSLIVDVLDYKNANKNKTIRALVGHDNNGTGSLSTAQRGLVTLVSGLWRNVNPIDTITFYGYGTTNNNYAAGTQLSLYGVK